MNPFLKTGIYLPEGISNGYLAMMELCVFFIVNFYFYF
jgi:hypothetical protein